MAKAVLAKMRTRLPNAIQMVYDNYNFLVIGFSPTERPSEAQIKIVATPRREDAGILVDTATKGAYEVRHSHLASGSVPQTLGLGPTDLVIHRGDRLLKGDRALARRVAGGFLRGTDQIL